MHASDITRREPIGGAPGCGAGVGGITPAVHHEV